ncbi:NAD(P)H-dependent oxidoreductase [Chthonobacter rhizosphaerae]|uniref:NAD(P)H-dependent oxidoreductase n=1 Tax=Chthonobacter rhizosphaerae TaxID=2735553 RepID=UPI0015EE88C9|nr:NAD(P)H-dependent oxidoreductase [Chthonobacter rhizosphaerae]
MTADQSPSPAPSAAPTGRRIVVVDGHPDPDPARLCHALAAAYADGAREAGHAVEVIPLCRLDIPFLRTQAAFEHGAVPDSLKPAADAIVAADHLVLVFPLWLGTAPALVKAFLEQVARPGIAFAYREKGFPEKRFKGKSARLVVTMGMPAAIYRWWYGALGIRGIERNILAFVGVSPIRRTLIGGVGAPGGAARAALERMRALGARAA